MIIEIDFEDPLAINQVKENGAQDILKVTVKDGTIFKTKDYFITNSYLEKESYLNQKRMVRQMKNDFASELLAASETEIKGAVNGIAST